MKTKQQIEKSRLNNKALRHISEVIETVETIKSVDILYRDAIYKEGFKDCFQLFKHGLSKLEDPANYAEISNLKNKIDRLQKRLFNKKKPIL